MKTLPSWIDPIVKLISMIRWPWLQKLVTGKAYGLTLDDQSKLFKLLEQENYIILNYTRSHLSSFFIKLAHLLLTKRWPAYCHIAANIENDVNNKIQIAESTHKGTNLTTFEEFFKCDRVVLLKLPKNHDEFIASLKANLNKPYDDNYNLADNSELSCIEYIYDALKAIPDIEETTKKLDYMINKYQNLDPQMLLDSGAFEVVLEIKR